MNLKIRGRVLEEGVIIDTSFCVTNIKCIDKSLFQKYTREYVGKLKAAEVTSNGYDRAKSLNTSKRLHRHRMSPRTAAKKSDANQKKYPILCKEVPFPLVKIIGSEPNQKHVLQQIKSDDGSQELKNPRGFLFPIHVYTSFHHTPQSHRCYRKRTQCISPLYLGGCRFSQDDEEFGLDDIEEEDL